MSISAKELAEKLNISAATVSLVLNNKPGISEKTRELVMATAHEYGFDFSRLAAKNASSGNICLVIYKKHGIIVADTPFFSRLLEGIEQCCQSMDFTLRIMYFYESRPCEQQIEAIKNCDCDGIILLGTEMLCADFAPFDAIDIPIVVLDTYFDEQDYDFVTINNEKGSFAATEYLILQGCTDIGYLRSSYEITNFSERFCGYCRAMAKHNLTINQNHIHFLTPSAEKAYEDMMRIQTTGLAAAYVADNDLIAAGACRALKEHGVQLPEDVCIIGFDNMPLCEILEPPLSTLDVQKRELGSIAVKQLIERLHSAKKPHTRIQLSPRLYIRGSANPL